MSVSLPVLIVLFITCSYDMKPQVESLMYTSKVKIKYIRVLSAWCFAGTSFFGHPRKEALQLVALSWMVGV